MTTDIPIEVFDRIHQAAIAARLPTFDCGKWYMQMPYRKLKYRHYRRAKRNGIKIVWTKNIKNAVQIDNTFIYASAISS